jgi:hypothetical protein
LKGFFDVNNTNLLIVFVDQPDGADANPLVDPQIILTNSCSPFHLTNYFSVTGPFRPCS